MVCALCCVRLGGMCASSPYFPPIRAPWCVCSPQGLPELQLLEGIEVGATVVCVRGTGGW